MCMYIINIFICGASTQKKETFPERILIKIRSEKCFRVDRLELEILLEC